MPHKTKYILILIFAAGSLIRLADAFRPVDHASWREADEAAIARNYAAESMNLFYPRIDWRGNTAGFTEMEFPIYPFLVALTYKIFGVHDLFGRLWAFVFSLGTIFFFYKLAREYLSGFSLIFAGAFFTFNPLIVEFSTSIQPEGLMILFYISAAYFFLKWLKTNENFYFISAIISTALTLLAKATAAHIGLFFFVLLFQKFGFDLFKKIKVWIFGFASLFPALIWYLHAKNLWLSYGNSLGVSNEYHWIGADFFMNSYFIKGILSSEIFVVWAMFGLLAGIFAAVKGFNEKGVKDALVWLVSAFVFYLITARTSADDWASYYHIFSIPPAALLFGFGVKKFWEYLQNCADFFSEFSGFEKLIKAVLIFAAAVSIALTFLLEAKQIRARILQNRKPDESFDCAKKIKPFLKNEGLILVSGGNCFDADGFQTAYNASFMFYWLERKGFNICVEDQSVEKVKEFSASGAKYFVAEKNLIEKIPGFERNLKNNFPIVAECAEFYVFDLERN